MTKNDAEKAIEIAAEIAAMEVITLMEILMEISKTIAIKIHGHEWKYFIGDIYRCVADRYDDVILTAIKEVEQKNNVN